MRRTAGWNAAVMTRLRPRGRGAPEGGRGPPGAPPASPRGQRTIHALLQGSWQVPAATAAGRTTAAGGADWSDRLAAVRSRPSLARAGAFQGGDPSVEV